MKRSHFEPRLSALRSMTLRSPSSRRMVSQAEGSEFRHPTVAATSSLSIAEEQPSDHRFSSVVAGRVLWMLGSREVSDFEIWPCVHEHRVTHSTLCPSDNQK